MTDTQTTERFDPTPWYPTKAPDAKILRGLAERFHEDGEAQTYEWASGGKEMDGYGAVSIFDDTRERYIYDDGGGRIDVDHDCCTGWEVTLWVSDLTWLTAKGIIPDADVADAVAAAEQALPWIERLSAVRDSIYAAMEATDG